MVSPLPPVSLPFAVRPTPHVRPDLWPLARPLPAHVEDDGPPTLVRLDAEVPQLIAATRAAVHDDASAWTAHVSDLDPTRVDAAGVALARAVSEVVPDLVQLAGDRLTLPADGVAIGPGGTLERVDPVPHPAIAGGGDLVARRLAAVPPGHRYLEAVALATAEDVVLVDAAGRAVWLHVCAPSGWDPGASAGMMLAELHGPVPAADRLRAASAALARAIVTAGPHVRWVWGLTDDPAAAHHPRFRRPPTSARDEIGALTFRAERQTTLPLPDLGLGVFLIRVNRAPLAEVVAADGRRERLAAAIASLPPDLAAYKGVEGRRREVVAWLVPGSPRSQ